MGNQASVKLKIDLDSDPQDALGQLRALKDGSEVEYSAGTPMCGEIVLDVQGGGFFRGGGGTLMLHTMGFEQTSIATGKKATSRVSRKERVFFQSSTELCRWSFRRRCGEHKFPFSIMLPESLPSTFSHGSDRHGCRIAYCLRARFRNDETSRNFRVFAAPLPDTTVPCFLEPQTEFIKSLGVRRVGSITFGAGVNDAHIGKGKELDVALACRNNAAVDIRSVNIKLVELITWQASLQKEQSKRVLVSKQALDLPGLMTRAQSTSSRGAIDSCNYEAIYESLRSNNNVIRVQVPTAAQNTYAGKLLTVSHCVKIYLTTRRFVNNISFKIPVQIGSAPSEFHSAMGMGGRTSEPQGNVQSENAAEAWQPPTEFAPVSMDRPSTQPAVPMAPTAPLEDYSVSPRRVAPTAPTEDEIYVNIPFAAAVPIPTRSTVRTPVVDVSGEHVVLGDTRLSGNATEDRVIQLESVAAPPQHTFAILIEDMSRSVNDYDSLSRKLHDQQWRRVLESLSSQQFGQIIAAVSMEFDQVRVARLLAPYVKNQRVGFDCSYCVRGLQNTARWNRIAMVQRLLPHVRDLGTNHGAIQAEMTEWERTVTARDLDKAMQLTFQE